jgi:hypothetical protein
MRMKLLVLLVALMFLITCLPIMSATNDTNASAKLGNSDRTLFVGRYAFPFISYPMQIVGWYTSFDGTGFNRYRGPLSELPIPDSPSILVRMGRLSVIILAFAR